MPKITRMTSSEVKLNAAAVRPQKIDQTTEAMAKTFLPPMRSEKYPPTKQNAA